MPQNGRAAELDGLLEASGGKRLPDGSIGFEIPSGTWRFVPVVILVSCFFAALVLVKAWLDWDWHDPEHRYHFWVAGATAALLVVPSCLGATLRALGRTRLILSADGLAVTRIRPLWPSRRRQVGWEQLRGCSMTHWGSGGRLPKLRLELDGGGSLTLGPGELPAVFAHALGPILAELPVPEQARTVLLAAVGEYLAVAERQPSVLAAVPPPATPGMKVLENTPFRLRVRFRGHKAGLGANCVFVGLIPGMIAVFNGVEGLAYVGGWVTWTIASAAAGAVGLAAGLHFFMWRAELEVTPEDLTLAHRGLFPTSTRRLDRLGASLEVREASARSIGAHVRVESGGSTALLGDGMAAEALGWLQARIEALWGLQPPATDDPDEGLHVY